MGVETDGYDRVVIPRFADFQFGLQSAPAVDHDAAVKNAERELKRARKARRAAAKVAKANRARKVEADRRRTLAREALEEAAQDKRNGSADARVKAARALINNATV